MKGMTSYGRCRCVRGEILTRINWQPESGSGQSSDTPLDDCKHQQNYEAYCLQESDAVFLPRSLPTYQRHVLPLCSWYVRSSEISVNLYQTTRHHIPQESNIYSRRHQNFRYHNCWAYGYIWNFICQGRIQQFWYSVRLSVWGSQKQQILFIWDIRLASLQSRTYPRN
jgi:hypothetical protein